MRAPALTPVELRQAIAERIRAAEYAELVVLTEAFTEALRVRVGPDFGGRVAAAARGLFATLDRAHGRREAG